MQDTSLPSPWFKNKSKGKPELSLFLTLSSIKGELHSASKEFSKVLARWENWDGSRKVRVETARVCLRMRGLLDQREGWRRSSRWLRHLAVFPGLLSEVSVGLLVSSLALGEKALSTLIERHRKAIAGFVPLSGDSVGSPGKGRETQ